LLNFRVAQFGQFMAKWYVLKLEPLLFSQRRTDRLKSFMEPSQVSQLKVAAVNLNSETSGLSPLVHRYQRYYCQFYHQNAGQAGWQDVAGIAMLLPLHTYENPAQFNSSLKKHAYNFWRDAEKAKRAGLFVQPFEMSNHTPDLLAIRRSRKIRAFGPVLEAFTLQLKDLGGAPKQLKVWQPPAATEHWDLYVGVFKTVNHYLQGEITTGQQLLAYARVHRIGNMLRYAELMGHAEFQAQGVMNLLHSQLVNILLQREYPWLCGVEYLSYGALEQGREGLAFWKRKAQFLPYRLQLGESSQNANHAQNAR